MTIKAFQIAVTAKGRADKQIFAVEASSEPAAEKRLAKDPRVPPVASFRFERMLNSADMAKHRIEFGSIVQLR
jgi:hypothetical protein